MDLADSAYREAATAGRGEGVGGTFTGIICLPQVTKSSIFVSSWAKGQSVKWSKIVAEWGKKLGKPKKPATYEYTGSSKK